MVLCAIFGCGKRSVRDKTSFYRLPSAHPLSKHKVLIERRRRAWLSRINRADLNMEKLKYVRVCASHFHYGKPCDLLDENNPDWAPSLNLGYDGNADSSTGLARYKRICSRSDARNASVITTAAIEDTMHSARQQYDSSDAYDIISGTVCRPTQTEIASSTVSTQTEMCYKHQETQTDVTVDYCKLQDDWEFTQKRNCDLEQRLKKLEINEDNFQDEKKLHFYTGLKNFQLLMVIFRFVEPLITSTSQNSLSKFQEFLLFFMRIRLNLLFQDLAYRFDISQSSASRIFSKWLDAMHSHLQNIVFWPEREAMVQTMPVIFKQTFENNVAVIIDCFEINCDRPSSLISRAATWSNYKSHNTVKFLIGITPQGTISYISNAWGGRASDKHITENCGILDNLLPGDWVLADRGFHISDSVGFYSAQLIIPAYLRNKKQLSPTDIHNTRKIASLRIHVERVIGLIKNKFKILQTTLPTETLTTIDGQTLSPIDKIVRVCCALINLCPSVIPE